MKLKLLALTITFFFVASTHQVIAAIDINSIRFPASNMDNWASNFIVGLINRSAMTALIGCPLDQVLNGSEFTLEKAKTCVGNSAFGGGGGGGGSSSVGVSPSVLGLVSTLAFVAPQRSDIYPVNLALYFEDIKTDSILAPKSAYADTFGESIMNTFGIGLWKTMRNLSYVLFVLMLVMFGFMVMFRYKINPQTVITVQAALPRVVINLLLITFSYPIGALAIDLIGRMNVLALTFMPFNAADAAAGITFSTVGMILATVGTGGVGGIFVAIALLIAVVAVILTVFAVAISVITRVGRIILMTIFAPIQFAFATIPGKEDLISSWFKSLIGNAVSIPAMILMMVLGMKIMLESGGVSGGAGAPGWNIVMGFVGGFVGFIMGIWILWNARNAPKWIEGAMGIGGGWSPGQAPKPGGKK